MKQPGLIRMAVADDARDVREIYAPFVTDSAVSFEQTPPTESEMAQRIRATLERTPWLVYEENSRVLGYAYAGKHRDRAAYQWSVEVSAYLRTEAHGKGIARALYDRLFRILVVQGFYSAFAGITLPNDASVAFHRAAGFQWIGTFHSIGYKFGQWHDTGWLERSLRSYDPPAEPPIPLSHIPCTAIDDVLKHDQ
ncbi:MAG: arsinothricin resistance N-acetyltransferase ArsN1 family B [Gemmatimonadota bacterium]